MVHFLSNGIGLRSTDATAVVGVEHWSCGPCGIGNRRTDVPKEVAIPHAHFCAEIHAFDFSFAHTATNFLFPFASPIDGATQVGDEGSQDGPTFFHRARFTFLGFAGVLWSPIGVTEAVKSIT